MKKGSRKNLKMINSVSSRSILKSVINGSDEMDYFQ